MKTYFYILFFALLSSCEKYLEKVPDKSLSVLTNLNEYQRLLDERGITYNLANLTEFGADNFEINYSTWQSRPIYLRNTYIWNSDIYEGNDAYNVDWRFPYGSIYVSNVVLEGLEKIKDRTENVEYNYVKSHALFVRAFSHYQIAETYGQPFQPTNSEKALGIPLRLNSKLDEPIGRSSVKETFNSIISDLKYAAHLNVYSSMPIIKTRPSRATIYAMLARVYLNIQDYNNALIYADSCLLMDNSLLDYNNLNPSSLSPFPAPANIEVSYAALKPNGLEIFNSNVLIDSELYNSYENNDLRKVLFFNTLNGRAYMKASYTGSAVPFLGLANDEVYLIKAECLIRKGHLQSAMDALNSLLIKRYKQGTFIPRTTSDLEDGLKMVLWERRKTLLFRGIRWSDLRRLNQDNRFAKTLERNLNGIMYTLPPMDKRYTFPIPPGEILISGIEQNDR